MFSPSEIAENYINIAKTKTSQKWYKALVLAVLAGAFIAFGAAVSTAAASGFTGGAAAAIKGAVFPVGLILVVLCGAELFTGNCLLVSPAVERKIKVGGMLKNWGIVYLGNLIGGVLIAVLVTTSGALRGAVGDAAIATAVAKSTMNFGEAVLRGILCNMLVCLAVFSAMSSKSAAGKILAVYLPVFAFVACGFEHSVANMYYLTAGLIQNALTGGAASLTLGNSLLYCLLPSTIGNIIGGAFIALCFFTAFRVGKRPTATVSSETTAQKDAEELESKK